MDQVVFLVDHIVQLENEVGCLLQEIDYARMAGSIVKMDQEVLSTEEYVQYLESEIFLKEQILSQVIADGLQTFSLDDFYQASRAISGRSANEGEMDQLFAIFDLIEQKQMSIERGR